MAAETNKQKKSDAVGSYELARARQKRLEYSILGSAIALALFVGFAAVYDNGSIMKAVVDSLQSLNALPGSSSNPADDCTHIQNRNTPYCQDRNASEQKSWKSVSSGAGGNQFSLHGR